MTKLVDLSYLLLLTRGAVACQISPAKYATGCSSAPGCDDRKCQSYTQTCTQKQETRCMGCFAGPPGCPGGWWSDSSWGNGVTYAKNNPGASCGAVCCSRMCMKTHSRSCPAVGCCEDTCPEGYQLKDDADNFTGATTIDNCCTMCTANEIRGSWIYLKDTSSGESMTVTEGWSSEQSYTKTEAYETSVTMSIGTSMTVGATLTPEGVGVTGEATTSVSLDTTVGKYMENSVSKTVGKSGETSVTYSHPHAGLAFWQFQYLVDDTCGGKVTLKTEEYAYSYSRDHRPRCLPGYCDKLADPFERCCACKSTPDEVDVTMPGSSECVTENWDTCASTQRVPVVLGGSVEVGPPSEMAAGTQVTIPCNSMNPAYSGDISISCTKNVEVVADVSQCSQSSDTRPSDDVLDNANNVGNICICSAGTPAPAALCDAMGATFCISCFQGFVRNAATRDCEATAKKAKAKKANAKKTTAKRTAKGKKAKGKKAAGKKAKTKKRRRRRR